MAHTFLAGEDASAANLNDACAAGQEVGSSLVAANGASGITTTETVLDYVTVNNIISGKRYDLWWDGDLVFATANSTWSLRARYLAGATLIIAGSTQFRGRTIQGYQFGNHEPNFMRARFTAPASGQFSIGVSLVRLLGTGTAAITGASGNERACYVDAVS